MEDSRMLYDAFNIYYEKGMDALKICNSDVAKRNLLLAAETMLKLAKNSEGSLKEKRMKRADELEKLANEINGKELKQSSNDKEDNVSHISAVMINEPVTLDAALDELVHLEGLKGVKQQVSDLVDQLKVAQMRKEQGLPFPEMSNHMVFTGNPGTGKTTVARIIGKIYKALGLLSKGHLVEVDRSDLVAGYVGQTAIKTKEVISKALGGVLFIDEAYTLKKNEGNDFGQEAIDTLNKMMEDNRNDLVVIAAGYADEMKPFISSNQGLKSRFRTFIDFKDYSGKELYNIFMSLLTTNKYVTTDDANEAIFQYLNNKEYIRFNGNARDVRNFFENILKLQSRRVASIAHPTKEDLLTIMVDDLPFDYKDFKKVNLDSENKTDECSIYKPSTNSINIEENKADAIMNRDRNNSEDQLPEKAFIDTGSVYNEYKFDWDTLPKVKFSDIAGLDYAKDVVRTKVLLPLTHPELFDGYMKKNGGGLFLYGPPGTGKTMIAAAIANEIGAKFCSVKPSDLLNQGAGNTEKAVRSLFSQARQHKCSVIYFDEMDSIAQKNTKSSYSRQLRSELLSQMQGIESYNDQDDHILFLIAATNKPWDVDSAFVRPGRFGTRVYIGLPDDEAREYMVRKRLDDTVQKGIVKVGDDVDIQRIVENTNGFNCSDITNLLDRVDELSAVRSLASGNKYIAMDDFYQALEEIESSVQSDDIERLIDWKNQNS